MLTVVVSDIDAGLDATTCPESNINDIDAPSQAPLAMAATYCTGLEWSDQLLASQAS